MIVLLALFSIHLPAATVTAECNGAVVTGTQSAVCGRAPGSTADAAAYGLYVQAATNPPYPPAARVDASATATGEYRLTIHLNVPGDFPGTIGPGLVWFPHIAAGADRYPPESSGGGGQVVVSGPFRSFFVNSPPLFTNEYPFPNFPPPYESGVPFLFGVSQTIRIELSAYASSDRNRVYGVAYFSGIRVFDPLKNDVTEWTTYSLEPLADETPIPEPETFVVVAAALVLFIVARRRLAGLALLLAFATLAPASTVSGVLECTGEDPLYFSTRRAECGVWPSVASVDLSSLPAYGASPDG